MPIVSDVGRSGDGHLTHRPHFGAVWGSRTQTHSSNRSHNFFMTTCVFASIRWGKDLSCMIIPYFYPKRLCDKHMKKTLLRRSMNQKLSSTSRQVELLEANWDTLIKKANFCCDAWHLHKKIRGGSLVILFICDSMNSQKTNLDTSKKHSILYSTRLTKRSFARMYPGCSPFAYHLPLPRGGGRNQSTGIVCITWSPLWRQIYQPIIAFKW